MLPRVDPVLLSDEHFSQSALEDLPSSERYVSTGHFWHDCSPLVSWKVPAAHGEQIPSLKPYLPRSLNQDEKKYYIEKYVESAS